MSTTAVAREPYTIPWKGNLFCEYFYKEIVPDKFTAQVPDKENPGDVQEYLEAERALCG